MSNQSYQQGIQTNGGYWISNQATSGYTSYGAGASNVGTQGSIGFTIGSIGNATAPPSIEEAGIRAGEIIGYRAWHLVNGILRSVFVDFSWNPEGVGQAQYDCYDYWPTKSKNRIPLERHGVGYHAFKSLKEVKDTYNYPKDGNPVVLGQVAMWGDVLEHERGWKSEYAKVHSIIGFGGMPKLFAPWKYVSLARLRRRYGV